MKLWADRIRNLPPYLFAELDKAKAELQKAGNDIIDLSIGDPDLPTPQPIVEKMAEEIRKPEHHRYPSYVGSERYRSAVAAWYEDRFSVGLHPKKDVLALIGSKEGIAHAPLALMNPGDVALVPDPGYPVYATATTFAGGTPVAMPLNAENQYLPELANLPTEAKLMFLNYPNNPTSATADRGDFEKQLAYAQSVGALICHDAAYTEVVFGGVEPVSFLQNRGAKEGCLEFHSLSKTFNMTGWRIGFVVGNTDAIAALAKIKTNVDSGVFTAIQEAGITALENWKEFRDVNNKIYERRRDIVCEGLTGLGIKFLPPKATFYVWCDVPTDEKSADYCQRILKECGVLFTPGIGFGECGEGHFRIALTASEVRLQEALKRLK